MQPGITILPRNACALIYMHVEAHNIKFINRQGIHKNHKRRKNETTMTTYIHLQMNKALGVDFISFHFDLLTFFTPGSKIILCTSFGIQAFQCQHKIGIGPQSGPSQENRKGSRD